MSAFNATRKSIFSDELIASKKTKALRIEYLLCVVCAPRVYLI